MDAARQTVRANLTELAGLVDTPIDGSGVTVLVLDDGINSVFLNERVASRNYCPGGSCGFDDSGHYFGRSTLSQIQIEELNSTTTSHGTRVAQIIAATGMGTNNGLAPGVRLLDGHIVNSREFVNAADLGARPGRRGGQL